MTNKSIRQSDNQISFEKKYTVILLLLIIFVYILSVLLRVNEYHHPFYDDYAYYGSSLNIKNILRSGSYLELIKTSSFPYVAILSTFVDQSYHFFNNARIINILFGIFMILAIYFVGKRLFNQSTGLIASFIVSINPIVLERSAILAPENMLLFFSILAYYYYIKGFSKPFLWIPALIFTVMAYFSKFNGGFLFGGFICSLLTILIFHWKDLKNRYTYLSVFLFMCFVLILFSSKIYEVINLHTIHLFLMKKAGFDITEFHGISNYTHYKNIWDFINTDFWGFINRILWGVTSELHRFSVGLFLSMEWKIGDILSINLGMITIPFFIWMILKDPNKERRIFSVVFVIVIFLGCVPRASANHSAARYSIMAAPLFYFYISPYLYQVILLVRDRLGISIKSILIIIFVFVISINGIIYYGSFKQFSFYSTFEPEYQKALDWLKNNSKPREVIVVESNSKLQFSWYLNGVNEIITTSTKISKNISDNEMTQYFRKISAKYIIIDGLAKQPYLAAEPRYFFKQYIQRKNGFLDIKQIPEGYKIVFQDHNPPKRIIILEIIK